MLIAALQQCWPPFVLVTGLLLVGLVAGRDGLFDAAASVLERLPGSSLTLFAACCLAVAVTAATLNLDTAAMFLTPVLLATARRRGVSEEPFLYGALFMANASSLYLPGSNLTNLLVFAGHGIAGTAFFVRMLPAALTATVLSAAALMFAYRGALCGRISPAARSERTSRSLDGHAVSVMSSFPDTSSVRDPRRETTGGHRLAPSSLSQRRFTLLCVVAVAALMVVSRAPALPVLGVGVLAAATRLRDRTLAMRDIVRGVGPLAIAGLFALAVVLGVIARASGLPRALLVSADAPLTTAIAAIGSVLVNNLPAAALLSAGHLKHPVALLIGLDIGPNLAVSGSLAALLWWRAAKESGAHPSALRCSRIGIFIAPPAIAAALALSVVLGR